MKATREEQKAEALVRMKMLKLHPNPIREFEASGKLNLSESYGALYWLDDAQKKRVADFEKNSGAMVYHVIRSYTSIGEMLALLYVSSDKDEWEADRQDLAICDSGSVYPLVYVVNLDYEYCSEFGSIGVRPQFGGLVRTA